MHRLEIRQRAAEPVVVHIRHVAAFGVLPDGARRGLLGADEQDGAAVGRERGHEIKRLFQKRQGLVKINDVNAVVLAVDVGGEFGVPEAGPVPEMNARLEQLAHGYFGHVPRFHVCMYKVPPKRAIITARRRARQAPPRPPPAGAAV